MLQGRNERGRVICSHFETMAEDVLKIYKQVTGEHLDLHVNRDEDDEDDE